VHLGEVVDLEVCIWSLVSTVTGKGEGGRQPIPSLERL